MNNPLLSSFDLVPFQEIEVDHYLPAVHARISEAKSQISAIVQNPEPPTFSNTLEALDYSSLALERVSQCFFNLLSAETSQELQAKAQEISPLLSAFKNDVLMDADLFGRIKSVYDHRRSLKLNTEQMRLLETTYQSFCRNGALLTEEEQEKIRAIDAELARATLTFGNNILAETNAFELCIANVEELDGLPAEVIQCAQTKAKEKGKKGYLLGLDFPCYMPVMKFAKNRSLRKEMWLAYGARAAQKNEQDNTGLIKTIVGLRQKRAEILGYATHADFVLEQRMAKSTQTVSNFLEDLIQKATPAAQKELERLRSYGANHHGIDRMEPWDQAFLSEGLKKHLYQWDEQEVKNYFALDQVLEGVFLVAEKLFGLSFKRDVTIPVYHEQVKAYRVLNKASELTAVLYTDFHPRPSKRNGAWMTSYKTQYKKDKKNHRPHISIVCNFTHPDDNGLALLSFQEVTTLFHEFGHALHGILADTQYPSLSGTNVAWDFVELPSQIMENWCFQQESLDLFASHWQSKESLPEKYLNQIKALKSFQEGLQTMRQIGFASLDMAYHSNRYTTQNIREFEQQLLAPTQLLKHEHPYCTSTGFSHIFQGGYAAGYYSYKWAEVLDADAFSLFEEKGIFDAKTANSFAKHILSQGGTQAPEVLYRQFRGRDPKNEALLKRAGLLQTLTD